MDVGVGSRVANPEGTDRAQQTGDRGTADQGDVAGLMRAEMKVSVHFRPVRYQQSEPDDCGPVQNVSSAVNFRLRSLTRG